MEQRREEKRLERRREREKLDNKAKDNDTQETQENVRNVTEKTDVAETKPEENSSKALDLKEQNYSDEKDLAPAQKQSIVISNKAVFNQ